MLYYTENYEDDKAKYSLGKGIKVEACSFNDAMQRYFHKYIPGKDYWEVRSDEEYDVVVKAAQEMHYYKFSSIEEEQ